MSSITPKKSLAQLVKVAEGQGWVITKTGGDHLRWQPPDGGQFVTTSSTPGDENIIHTIKRDLKRQGLILDKEELRRLKKAYRTGEGTVETLDGDYRLQLNALKLTVRPPGPLYTWTDEEIMANIRQAIHDNPDTADEVTLYGRIDSLTNRERKALIAMHRRCDEYAAENGGEQWWPTTCATCGYSHDDAFQLALHLVANRNHQPEPLHPDTEEPMKRNMVDPPARERLNCPFCPEWFWLNQTAALASHARNEHAKEECPYCHNWYSSLKGGLTKHMRTCLAGGEAARQTIREPEPLDADVVGLPQHPVLAVPVPMATTGHAKMSDDFNPDPCIEGCGRVVGQNYGSSRCGECQEVWDDLQREAADVLAAVPPPEPEPPMGPPPAAKEPPAPIPARVIEEVAKLDRIEREAAQRDEAMAVAARTADPTDDELFSLLELVLDGPVMLNRDTFAAVNDWMDATRKLLAIKYGEG